MAPAPCPPSSGQGTCNLIQGHGTSSRVGKIQGLPKKSIAPLQRVQNAAARLITRTRKHITPILKDLHWLPVAEQIKYKVLMLTYRTVNNLAPVYLQYLIHPHSGRRTTHLSQNSNQIQLKAYYDFKVPGYRRAVIDF